MADSTMNSECPDLPIPGFVFTAANDSQSMSDMKPREATLKLGKLTITVHPGPHTSALVTWPPDVGVHGKQTWAKMDWNASTTEAQGPAWLRIQDETSDTCTCTKAEGSAAVATLGDLTVVVRFQSQPLTEAFKQKMQHETEAGDGLEGH